MGLAVGTAVGTAAKIIVAHGAGFGLIVATTAYVATASAGPWRAFFALLAVLGVHAAIVPVVAFWSAIAAAGSAVQKLGIGSSILGAASRRAEAINPRIRSSNDFDAVTKALAAAFESLAQDELAPDAGGVIRMRMFSKRIGRRVIRTVGRVIIRQLDLAPKKDGVSPYNTLDEWMGSRIDLWVGSALKQPAFRWITGLLAIQIVATIGAIAAAR